MIQITIPAVEKFDERTSSFFETKECRLMMEHSLVSISKWESKWKKSFFHDQKTPEETIDYFRCMTITQNVDPTVYYDIPLSEVKRLEEYMTDPMTATTFTNRDQNRSRKSERLTSEIIYYLMFSYQVPIDCEKWHINRLLALLKVFELKNASPKKMSKGEIMRQNSSLNAARRAAMHSKG